MSNEKNQKANEERKNISGQYPNTLLDIAEITLPNESRTSRANGKPTRQNVEKVSRLIVEQWQESEAGSGFFGKCFPKASVLWHLYYHCDSKRARSIKGKTIEQAVITYITTGLHNPHYVEDGQENPTGVK